MVEVGVRQLKSRLSYYLQLMQAGETIAVKVRDRVVGFLSKERPPPPKRQGKKSGRSLDELIAKWKREGFIVSGGNRYRHRHIKRVRLKGGVTGAELIRQIRDEE